MTTSKSANHWYGIGRVAQEIRYGRTTGGDIVCSFQVTTMSRGDRLTWVRINVYDQALVKRVKREISKGLTVHVEGELMNRNKGGDNGPQLTEVRAFVISPMQDEGHHGSSQESG